MKHKRILIVDGYNVLNAWRPANGMDSRSLSDARDALTARLQDYAGFSGQKVILVYDAYMSGAKTRSEEQMGPLSIVYTRKGETADHYIERLCDTYASRAELGQIEVRVATSDLVEQMVVLGRHATRLSARELLIELDILERRSREGLAQAKAARSTVIDRVPEHVRSRLEAMRRGENHPEDTKH